MSTIQGGKIIENQFKSKKLFHWLFWLILKKKKSKNISTTVCPLFYSPLVVYELCMQRSIGHAMWLLTFQTLFITVGGITHIWLLQILESEGLQLTIQLVVFSFWQTAFTKQNWRSLSACSGFLWEMYNWSGTGPLSLLYLWGKYYILRFPSGWKDFGWQMPHIWNALL